MMRVKQILLLCLLVGTVPLAAQEQTSNYSLGQGLLRLYGKTLPLSWTDTVPLYNDSALTRLQALMTIEQTNCPQCLACAEPVKYYQGPFHPFFCGGGKGPVFICTRSTQKFHEIIIDSTGARAYVPAQYGVYDTWEQYILREAGKGEYFRIVRDWDSTVLYDKPYPATALPLIAPGFTVGTGFKDTDGLKFYPVAVRGTWMKLKAMSGKTVSGYCWIIWRNDKQLYKWFAWRAD